MSKNASNPNSYKKKDKQSISVPVVFFGAFSASVALMGSSAVSAQQGFQPTVQPSKSTLSEGPKLSVQPDGSVMPAATLPSSGNSSSNNLPSTQQLASHVQAKQDESSSAAPDYTDWRVIVTEDGTLAVVRADEVPENATEVTCTPDGVCTPVESVADEETTETENVMDNGETATDPSPNSEAASSESTNSNTTNSEAASSESTDSNATNSGAASSESTNSNSPSSEAASSGTTNSEGSGTAASDSTGPGSMGPGDGFS